jgi:hypothetical protein
MAPHPSEVDPEGEGSRTSTRVGWPRDEGTSGAENGTTLQRLCYRDSLCERRAFGCGVV